MTAKPSIEEIQRKVADQWDITFEELLSSNRTDHVARARSIAIFLACEIYPEATSYLLGEKFNRTHSLIRQRTRHVRQQMELDPKFREAVERARIAVKENGCVKSGQ